MLIVLVRNAFDSRKSGSDLNWDLLVLRRSLEVGIGSAVQ